MVEQQTMSGILTIVIRDRDGRVLEEQRVKNKITNQGRELVAKLFARKLNSVPEVFIVVGQGDKPADEKDTALAQPLDKPVAAESEPRAERPNVVTVKATLPALSDPNAKRELKEAGILISAQGTNYLYNRVTFPVVTQTASTTISLSWDVTF